MAAAKKAKEEEKRKKQEEEVRSCAVVRGQGSRVSVSVGLRVVLERLRVLVHCCYIFA